MTIMSLLLIGLGTLGPDLGLSGSSAADAVPAAVRLEKPGDRPASAMLQDGGRDSVRVLGLWSSDGTAVVEEEDSADDDKLGSGLQNHSFMSVGPPAGQTSHLRSVRDMFRASIRSPLLRC